MAGWTNDCDASDCWAGSLIPPSGENRDPVKAGSAIPPCSFKILSEVAR
jgi:hypothetical protein